MNNQLYCDNVNAKLSQLITELQHDSAANLRSINIHAESFFQEFLNTLYDWRLTNANAIDHNAQGIDLLYPADHIIVQVSSKTDREKVRSSLEKSQKYKGSHFYFLAIAARTPNYQNKQELKDEAEKYGLVFDPDKDVLTTTSLYDAAVKCGDIARQKRLSDLVDKYFELRERRKALDFLPLGSGKASTDYEYNAGAVPFLGREKEMGQLLDFVRGNDAEPFRWWAVTAPGAAGKTRLAYELQNRLLAEGGWDVVALSPAACRRENLLTLSEYLPAHTLVIADYVQQHAEVLGEWMTALAAPNAQRKAPLRLLLLERDIKDENDRYPWLEEIKTADYHIPRHSYRPGPLELQPLRPEKETDKDPLLVLIRDFADHVYQKETTEAQGSETAEAQGISEAAERPALTPLPPGGEAEIRRRLDSVDGGLVRPLFAMLLADAWVHDPAAQHWEREDLLEYIVNREWGFVAKRLKPYHPASNPSLPNACRLLWLAATVLGANDGNGADMETLKTALPKHWSLVEKCAEKHEDMLLHLYLTPTEALLTEAGLFEQGKVPALRPDLLGEFFVLQALQTMPSTEAVDFYAGLLLVFDSALYFFYRCLTDYEGLVSEENAFQPWFFPARLELNDMQKIQYIQLMGYLFTSCRSKSNRDRLVNCMEAWTETVEDKDQAAAAAFHELGTVYHKLGDYPKAEDYLEKTLTIMKKDLNPDCMNIAVCYNSLAMLYIDMGNYPKALEYQKKDLALTIKFLGPDHQVTARAYNSLASVYQVMGNYPKALEYYEEALKIWKTVPNPDNPIIATTYNDLAALYQEMHDYHKAAKYHKKALEIWEKTLGPNHLFTASAYNNLAHLHQAKGNYLKALEYHQKALAIRESVQGPDHPSTATSYNNLALVYQAMGDYQKALEYNIIALAIRESVQGPDHPDTATTYCNLASAYMDIGNYPKALDHYGKALSIRETVLGLDNKVIATTYANLAVVYYKMGDYLKALEYLEKTLAILEAVLGPNHLDTVTTYKSLAAVYLEIGDNSKALEYYEKTLAIEETVLGPDHPDTATTCNNLGSVYQEMGDYPKALKYYKKVLATRETDQGPDHPNTAEAYNNLALVYYYMGRYPKALEYCEKALAIWETVLGPDHPRTALGCNHLAYVYHAMGDDIKALEYHQKTLAIQEKILGIDHPDTAMSYHNIGILYWNQNRKKEALPCLRRALSVLERVLGSEHPNTNTVKENLDNMERQIAEL